MCTSSVSRSLVASMCLCLLVLLTARAEPPTGQPKPRVSPPSEAKNGPASFGTTPRAVPAHEELLKAAQGGDAEKVQRLLDAARYRRAGQLELSVIAMLQTVPALALLMFMIPLFGIGKGPALVALSLYALLPIARNTYAGMMAIEPTLLEIAWVLRLGRVRRLLRGTTPEEYSAHLIPELGPADLPRLVTDGMVVIGGAAGLINANPIFHEGTNMAMASGILTARAIIEAHKLGDFSAAALSQYENALRCSFAWQDMERYQRLTRMAETHPQLFSKYPYEFARMAKLLMTVKAADSDFQVPKRQLELDVLDHFLADIGVYSFAKDMADVGRAML